MPGYYAKPQGAGPFPTILVNEEIFGVHEHIKDLCRRLAKVGYLAVAPEIYAREGDLSTMTDVGQIVSQVINKTPDADVFTDLDNAVAWAGKNGGDLGRLGVTGFCRGGRNTWFYDAHNAQVKAAVAWYGPIKGATSDIQPKTVMDIADQIHAPLLGLYGGKDTGIDGGRRASGGREGAQGRQDGGDPHLCGCAARFQCGLPAELPQGGCGGWLAADAGLVQTARRELADHDALRRSSHPAPIDRGGGVRRGGVECVRTVGAGSGLGVLGRGADPGR